MYETSWHKRYPCTILTIRQTRYAVLTIPQTRWLMVWQSLMSWYSLNSWHWKCHLCYTHHSRITESGHCRTTGHKTPSYLGQWKPAPVSAPPCQRTQVSWRNTEKSWCLVQSRPTYLKTRLQYQIQWQRFD